MENISRITIEHYSELINLWIDTGLEYRPFGRDSRECIQQQMENYPDSFWGCFKDNKLVGSIIITDDGRKGWINRVAVAPAFQHKGLAIKLIEFAEDLLRKKGINIVSALIYKSNVPSLQLFQKMEYEICSDICYLRHILKEGT